MDFDFEAFRKQEERMPRIKVLVGEYGSGKTELAVNLASYMQKAGFVTAVVDMDLVKPYFRTREHRERLEAEGVNVVAPKGGLAHADLPVMPTDLSRVLLSPEYRVVVDVGGAKSAIVLGQVRERIRDNGCEVLMVVNICRPFSASSGEIISAMRQIEAVTGLSVTGLVSNTNLGPDTTEEHVAAGLEMTAEVAAQSGVPVRWLVVPAWLFCKIEATVPLLPLRPMTVYPWDE